MFKLRSAYPSGQQQPLTNVKKIHNEFWSVEIHKRGKSTWRKQAKRQSFENGLIRSRPYQWMFDDFWWFLSGVDCSIGAAATGEFHALGDACKSGLLYLHETSPPEANLKPSRRRDSPNRSRTEPEVSGEGSVFNIYFNIWGKGLFDLVAVRSCCSCCSCFFSLEFNEVTWGRWRSSWSR